MTWRAQSGAPLDFEDEEQAKRLDIEEQDRYAKAGRLGAGGMGVVHRAHDHRLERDVAIKSMRPTASEQRFLKEAEITAQLQHPGILPIYSAGRSPEGTPYYTMRLLDGHTLLQAIDEARSLEAQLRLLRPLITACEAVAYAHDKGFVHRDLKPENIMIGPYGETVVLDWGLAARSGEAPKGQVGTPGYMSPEQQDGAVLDPSTDVYALGKVLEQLLCCNGELSPKAPPELVAVTRHATAQAPTDRYPNARGLATDLEAWFEGRRVVAHQYSNRELLARLLRRWRAPLLVAGGASVILTAGAIEASIRTTQERDRAVQAEGVALSAKQRSEQHLQRALVAQGRTAAEAGHRAEAEILAAEALVRGEDAVARGVMARFAMKPRPQVLHQLRFEACDRLALSPRGGSLACANAQSLRWIDLDTGKQRVHPAPVLDVGFASEDQLVFGTEGRTFSIWPRDGTPKDLGAVLERTGRPIPGPEPGTIGVYGGGHHHVIHPEEQRVSKGPDWGIKVDMPQYRAGTER